MSFNPEPFFPNEPKRPEKFPEDYEDNLDANCLISIGLYIISISEYFIFKSSTILDNRAVNTIIFDFLVLLK